MNKGYAKVLICCLAMQSLYASERALYEQHLSASEKECDPQAYTRLIKSENIKQWRKNHSFATIIRNCVTSGNLNEMIKANVSAGGQVTDTANFDSCQYDALYFFGYDKTALGFLARTGLAVQNEEITQDLEETTKTLVQNGCAVDTGLLDSFGSHNIPVAQALIKLGADPYKCINFGMNPVRSDVVTAHAVAEHKRLELKQFQIDAYLRAAEHFFRRTKYPNGSSYAKAQWGYGTQYGREAKEIQAFIKLFSKKS